MFLQGETVMPKLGMRLRLLALSIFLLFNLALSKSLEPDVKEYKLANLESLKTVVYTPSLDYKFAQFKSAG
jgi:hypothetical protein